MGIADRIRPADVVLDIQVTSKRGLLDMLAAEAAQRLGRPAEAILDALKSREKLGSTALGRGIALPHARLGGDFQPLVLITRLDTPIDFEARDEVPVDLVILVLWPEAEADGFLPALSATCRALRKPQALRRLRAASSGEEVVSTMAQFSRADAAEED
jgi:PTS system nitrogen regulatory IIA component